jgi:hypothetical protein
MSEPDTEPPVPAPSATPDDPDADPANLNPRDTLDSEPYEGDPDANPDNLNPRDAT